MAVPDIQLLSWCANSFASHLQDVESSITWELQTSSATRLIMGLRVCRLQRAIIAVGMFSLLESFLQDKMQWENPYKTLPQYLEQHNKMHLKQIFLDYKDAINVLKHGAGASHNRLLTRISELDFKVRARGELFCEEGDVSEVAILINIDDSFIEKCGELIEEITGFIELQSTNNS